ncbi:MAG: hypothetical protein ACC658_05525, partial [Acidimicrobiia bacterium]
MKMKGKWLAIFAVLGLVLAACSPSDGGATATTAAETPDTTAAETPDTTVAETPDTTEGAEEMIL